TAIRVDLDWERQHAEYERQATRGKGEVITHRRAVQQAQDWLAARPANATPVSEPVRNLIARSQKRLVRGQQALLAVLTTVALIMAGLLTGLFFQTRATDKQRIIAEGSAIQARQSLGLFYAGEAERLAGEFQTDAALLTLLEASEMAAFEDRPRIEAVFARILSRAEAERRFTIPGDSIAFEHANTLYYQVPSDGGLWRLDPQVGPIRIADWPGELLHTVEVAPQENFDIIAATRTDAGLVLAYVDPISGRQGLRLDIPIATQEWPQYIDIDIGPDGVGVVTVYPDYNSMPSDAWVREGTLDQYFAVDIGGGHSAAVDPEVNSNPRLRVDADGGSHILGWPGPRPLRFDSSGALRQDYSKLVGDPGLAPHIDCLARGLYPTDLIKVATQMLAFGDDMDGIYAEGGYSTPPTGHCLSVGGSLVFVGTFGTSRGGTTNMKFLSEASDGSLKPVRETLKLYSGHFRPSILQLDDGRVALTALDLNNILLFEATDDYDSLGTVDPTSFQFPYRVGYAILSSSGHLVALERNDLATPLSDLRVTVLNPDFVLSEPEGAESGYLDPDEPHYTIVTTDTGLALHRNDGGHALDLPSFMRSEMAFTELTSAGAADVASLLVSVDSRAVERITLHEHGGWSRELLFVAPHLIQTLTLHPDNNLLIVGMYLGGGDVEARVWSLADRREVAFLGEADRWMNFRIEEDGSVSLIQTGAVATSIALEDGQLRAEESLAMACRPEVPGEWHTSPCWPSHLQAASTSRPL
ncbi:hypothetical protein PVW53_21605, partial [Seohaeicola sp. SP36]|uniref:hypothetical protein n=1 Tax=unclassified Seohaeicola TaxID=2641111 RepID=UPI00237C220A